MKSNKFFSILIVLVMVITLVGCSSSLSNAVIIPAVEEETSEIPTLAPTATLKIPTPTLTPLSLEVDFSWKWNEVGSYLGKFLHPPVTFYDASEYLETRREKGSNFYLYVFDVYGENLVRTSWPLDYLITGPVCEYFRPSGTQILDDLICDKIIESKSKRFLEEKSPLYEVWMDNLEVDNDSIIFLTVEDDYNCFFWIDGGINVVQEDESVLFFDDEDIPLDEFTSEEIEMIRKGFTLIDRRNPPSEGKCNFFDFKEEITKID